MLYTHNHFTWPDMLKSAKRILPFILYTLVLLLLANCGGKKTLRGIFQKQTPYERYAAQLQMAKLDHTALGQEWLAAGQRALTDSINVTLPFRETGYFPADKPKALGYRFNARRGERIVVNLQVKARETVLVFMDVFEVPGGNALPKHVAAADTTAVILTYEPEDDLPHLVRVQPELLRNGQYTITIKAEPTLSFPVQGKTSRHIASVWGDPRDAGARLHEGVDIFATRGTPALAAAPGVVTRVSDTPRGGKVVWLADAARQQSLYYAHLDSQLVVAGQHVQTGDTLGLIGNTGNAITTNPHLHFGIYRAGRGATNPYPYLHDTTTPVPAVRVDTTAIGQWVRVSVRAANVRWQPLAKASAFQTLPYHTPLQVTGAAATWYRVALPDGAEAYIAATVVEPASKPIQFKHLSTQTELLDIAGPTALTRESMVAGAKVAVLGTYSGYTLVRSEAGTIGWVAGPDKSGAQQGK